MNNENNQLGSVYTLLDKVSSFLPEINTISGMLFYTFILYALGVLVKCCFAKPFNYEEEDSNKKIITLDIIHNNQFMQQRNQIIFIL